MAKFKEGEIVRSVLKMDEKFPFFQVHKEHNILGKKEYLVIPMDNIGNRIFASVRAESSLRHTERDSAGDE